ncbi:c-type cytochrome [Sphingomonas sp. HF-S3]|uniref:C-type cytochrome n=1 Tax=Sphingomonas rustica TaxID=3103142 RepID=A0ABV0B5V7_9SPHN
MRWLALAAAVSLSACGTPSAPGAADTGNVALSGCAACHSLSADGARGSGPALSGIVGRRAGALPDYAYSPALKASGITWSPQTLDGFLADPGKVIPGTRMMTRVPDPAQRKRIVDALTAQ